MNSRISDAAELLRNGRLVAFPTETVYGLGANALDAAAVGRIFTAKGRPQSSPLIVHVESVARARELALEWPEAAEKLAERFWPGPLTIIVPKRGVIPDIVTAGLPSVGLRMPAHPMALALLEAAGVPLAAPSANRFTELSPSTAADVPAGLCDMVLDGGPCTVGIESTVLSLAGPVPRILRAGMITRPQIEAVIGPVEMGEGAESPGQHPKHYRPKTRLVLGASPTEGRGIRLDMPADPAAYAERLYRVLHEMDREGYDWIALDVPPETPEWAGIRTGSGGRRIVKLGLLGHVIAIDGPAGAGKSTIARSLAQRLGYLYVDTGAMYRAIALWAIREGVSLDDSYRLGQLASAALIELRPIRLNGEDVTDAIREPAVAGAASKVAAVAGVRTALVAKQRELAATSNVVMEGRDIGTVVFPEARVKIFLDAHPEERVRRRSEDQPEVPPDQHASQIAERDSRDRQRVESPLVQAPDAAYVDSTGLTAEEVEEEILAIVRSRISNGKGA